MKLGTIDIKKAYFGTNELTSSNAYLGTEPIIPASPAGYDYLTFTSLQNGSTVKFSRSIYQTSCEYSTDNGTTWKTGNGELVTLNSGDKVLYRGTTISASNTSNTSFITTGQFKLSGSIMSMYNKNPNDTTISTDYAFVSYFINQSAIKDISELLLPATTVSQSCYQGMFMNCTGLTSISSGFSIPAVANSSCTNMFYGCNNLTSVPVDMLPSTTLATQCYCNMFRNCSKITQVPDLPATSSAIGCYQSMFEGCSSLVESPKIWLRETSSSQCLQLMFSSCTKLNRVYLRVYSGDSFSNSAYWLDSVANYGYIIVPAYNSNYKYSGFPSGLSGLPSTWGVTNSKWD